MSDTPDTPVDHVHAALLDAIDTNIAGEPLYPNGSVFINADQDGVVAAILDAAARGKPVVLCSADGTRQLLYPSEPAAA